MSERQLRLKSPDSQSGADAAAVGESPTQTNEAPLMGSSFVCVPSVKRNGSEAAVRLEVGRVGDGGFGGNGAARSLDGDGGCRRVA